MLNRRQILNIIGCSGVVVPFAAAGGALANTKSNKPLVILQCPVVGFHYYQPLDKAGEMQAGETLTLVREPQNTHDKNAIAIYWQEQKIGYVPRTNNTALAALMDDQQPLQACIEKVTQNPARPVWLAVAIAT